MSYGRQWLLRAVLAIATAVQFSHVHAAPTPFTTAWDNSIAICAIMRNEHTDDVREWLQYHRCGVAHQSSTACCAQVDA